MKRFSTRWLRWSLVAAFALSLILQLVATPLLAVDTVRANPDHAYLLWPWIAALVGGLACIEWSIAATWRLSGLVDRGQIFTDDALPLVDQIIGCARVATGIALLMAAVHLALGPGGLILTLLCLAVVGWAVSALLVVLRVLLREATTLHTDMAAVI